jgi:inorganic triphosphatase YgiF
VSTAAEVPGTTTQGPLEIELKYRLRARAAGERWLAAPEIGRFRPDGNGDTIEIEDRYLETAARSVFGSGFGARIRITDGSARITVKSTGARSAPGLPVRREELDGPADPDLPPAAWPPSAARDRLLAMSGDGSVVPFVTLRQVRHRREFVTPDGSRVEISLDDVAVEADGTVLDRFSELEIELLAGPEAALDELGTILAADPDLDGDGPSKLASAQAAVEAAAR